MGVFRDLLSYVLRDRHSTTITVTLPTQLLMAADTLVYLRNETSDGEVDRDHIVAVALSRYVQRHLVDKNEAKITSIPAAPPKPSEYTNGRRQQRAAGYTSYQAYQKENK